MYAYVCGVYQLQDSIYKLLVQKEMRSRSSLQFVDVPYSRAVLIWKLIRAHRVLMRQNSALTHQKTTNFTGMKWRRALVLQQKRHILACLRMIPFFRSFQRSQSNSIRHFIRFQPPCFYIFAYILMTTLLNNFHYFLFLFSIY